MNIFTKEIVSRIFTFSLTSYVVLYSYYFYEGFPICIGDIFLLISLLLCLGYLSKNHLKIKVNKIMIVWLMVIMFSLFRSIFTNGLSTAVLLNYLHTIFAFFVLAFFISDCFNCSLAIRQYRIIVLVASLIVIIQYLLMKIKGLYVMGTLPFLYIPSSYFDAFHPRPFAFFSEPSTFAFASSVYMCLEMFNCKLTVRKSLYIFLVMIASLLTKASTGVVLPVIVFLLFVIIELIHYSQKSIKNMLILGAGVGCLLVLILVTSGGLTFFISHIFDFSSGSISIGPGASGRISGVYHLMENLCNNDLFSLLFGLGMLELDFFVGGIFRLLTYYGVSGLVIIHLCLLVLFKNADRCGKALILVNWIYNLFAATYVGVFPLVFMPYIIQKAEENC